ncbi:hypothetical protein OS175_04825 [Marinicella sp. S1101]|nr:hypothetical protein [Marinicella marina]MCX7553190.1 hypothetical protein [Marinicella marina]MDJ1138922.1 hypothetical protein [Marinicella marina]
MSYRARDWDLVAGYIDEDDFYVSKDDEEEWFHALVRYHYKYKNITYKSKRIAFGFAHSTLEGLVLKPYLEVTRLKPVAPVFVNPKNPKVATLLVGLKSFHFYQLAAFAVYNAFVHYLVLNAP